jgi:hypothetical protein
MKPPRFCIHSRYARSGSVADHGSDTKDMERPMKRPSYWQSFLQPQRHHHPNGDANVLGKASDAQTEDLPALHYTRPQHRSEADRPSGNICTDDEIMQSSDSWANGYPLNQKTMIAIVAKMDLHLAVGRIVRTAALCVTAIRIGVRLRTRPAVTTVAALHCQ